MKVLAVGDVHADFYFLKSLIRNQNPDMILQCGDFGFWPNLKFYNIAVLKDKNCEIHFCPGNHEDWWSLNSLESPEIYPNIFYEERGSIKSFPFGNVLFMGGALSVDKELRTIGHDWFPEETITQQDIYDLPDRDDIDIVISHSCPISFPIKTFYDINDPSREALQYVLEMYKPKRWFFGHYHQFKTGIIDGCEWTCLNKLPDPKCYIEI